MGVPTANRIQHRELGFVDNTDRPTDRPTSPRRRTQKRLLDSRHGLVALENVCSAGKDGDGVVHSRGGKNGTCNITFAMLACPIVLDTIPVFAGGAYIFRRDLDMPKLEKAFLSPRSVRCRSIGRSVGQSVDVVHGER